MSSTAPSFAPRDAVLFVGHGTRSGLGRREFFRTTALATRLLRNDGDCVAVAPCLLELAEPTIEQAVRRLVRTRPARLVVVPVLLFAAGHAKRDIPSSVQRAVEATDAPPAVVHAGHLGLHERLIALSRLRRRQALLGARSDAQPAATRLLMVGRGSRDSEATAEMHAFSAAAADAAIARATETCFYAVEAPTLEEGLTSAAGSGAERVLVQPHLLFAGEIMDSVSLAVRRAAEESPRIDWRICPRLGPHPLLARALVARAREAAGSR